MRRKRFLAKLKDPFSSRHVRNVLRHQAGRDFDAVLKDWAEFKPGNRHPSAVPVFPSFQPVEATGPRCSVIINTVDRSEDLALTLEALRAVWDASRDELIIVLGPTNDDSAAVLQQACLPHQLIHCPERNLSVSRNLGLQAASGRFVAFIDDDASPEPGWLDFLLAPLERDSRYGVAAGFVLDRTGRRFLNRYVVADTLGRANWFHDEASARTAIKHLGKNRAFLTATGCNMAFRREFLTDIGGFDPAYSYFLEETDVVWRLHLQESPCVVAPQSLVRHRLGSNLVRKPSFHIEDRLVVIRSQIQFIQKYGKLTFPASEIENCIWQRVLGDLEKIAWDCGTNPSFEKFCADFQMSYLDAVTTGLRLDMG